MQQWTFFEYLQRLSQCSSSPEEALPVTVYTEKRLLLKESPTLSYVLDYRTGRYVHFSRNARQLTGFDRELFLSEGIHFTIQQHNRQDAEVYFNTIFPKRLQFLHKLEPESHMHYSFQHSFRFQHKDQGFVTFLQETKILKSDKMGPLVVLGYWTDITPFKEDSQITDVIKYTKPDEPQQLVEVNHYYPKSPESLLSVQYPNTTKGPILSLFNILVSCKKVTKPWSLC